MSPVVTIGEFSRLTHLSVKALRHYHDIGLLEPTVIDADTGYRRYAVDQVGTAQLIRRLRGLQMPIPQVLAVVTASDEVTRDAAIREHLRRMERELDRTRAVVGSLRDLLGPGPGLLPVEHRTVADLTALTVSAVVSRVAIDAWCGSPRNATSRPASATRATSSESNVSPG